MSESRSWHPADDESPREWATRLIDAPELRALISHFGGHDDVSAPLDQRLAALDEFSVVWDYRGGAERNLAEAREFDVTTEALVASAADAIGLVGPSSPSHDSYDQVLVLGGLVRACIARPLHAAKLIREGTIRTPRVIALGGFRELRGDEIELSAAVLPDDPPGDEFYAMLAGMRRAFSLGEASSSKGDHSETLGASWRIDQFLTDGALDCSVVAAPSSVPGERRANTADTYAWLACQPELFVAGGRVLLVTTAIYRTFQLADARRMLELPYGTQVDIVGTLPGDVDSRLTQEFEAHNYLQEIRSTIRALRLLVQAAAGY